MESMASTREQEQVCVNAAFSRCLRVNSRPDLLGVYVISGLITLQIGLQLGHGRPGVEPVL